MSVTSQIPRKVSTAAPGATLFPYDFKVLSKFDMQVQVDGVEKTVDVDYALSGVGLDAGGDITFLIPLAGGETVMRRRLMAFERSNDFQQLGDLRSPTLNNDQDAPIMMIQQVADDVDRSIKLPLASTGNGDVTNFTPLAPLVVSADGNGIEGGSTSLTGDMLLRGNLRAGGIAWGEDAPPSSIGFFTDTDNGANVVRFADRQMIGDFRTYGAEWNGGAGSVTGASVEAITLHGWAMRDSMFAGDSPVGAITLMGHSQSSKGANWEGSPTFTPSSIGVAGFSINDEADGQGWGLYGEVVRMAGSAFSVGAELAVANLGEVTTPTPSNIKSGGANGGVGLWLQSGAGLDLVGYDGAFGAAANPAAAIAIVSSYADNSIRFRKAIVIGAGSMDATAGSTSANGVGLEMPRNTEVRWLYSASGVDKVGGSIRASCSTDINQTRIDFSDGGFRVLGVDGSGVEKTAFEVVPNQTAVNYLSIYPQSTGQQPQIGAMGSDANIDVLIAPKGTGVLGLGYAAINATSAPGFAAQRIIPVRVNGVNLFIPAMTTGW